MAIIGSMAKTRVHTKTTKDRTEIKTPKIRKDVGRNLRSSGMVKNLRMNFQHNTIKMVGPENSQNITKLEVTLEEKIKTIISILLRTTSNNSNRTGIKMDRINSKCTLVPLWIIILSHDNQALTSTLTPTQWFQLLKKVSLARQKDGSMVSD